MRIKSAVDTWFMLCALVLPVGMLLAVAMTMGNATGVEYLIVLLAAVVFVGLPLWMMLGTGYEADSKVLTIRSGPFRWTVPISSIDSIEASRSLIASPALSLDRLRIHYGNGKSILISPKDAQGFRKALGF